MQKLKIFFLFFLSVILSNKSFGQAAGMPYIVPSNKTAVQFTYTGTIQTWTVPVGVIEIFVDVVGAQGGDFNSTDRQGGAGGKVQCRLVVVPNTILYITVGGKPLNTAIQTPVYGFGGAGGNTQFAGRFGAAGGGLSSISNAEPIAHGNVLVVAAGGGGATGGTNTNVGGAAGGLTGSRGGISNTVAGSGGTQIAGGLIGTGGDGNSTEPLPGAALRGGNGGIATSAGSSGWNGGGGGGAGYFGGGGGRAGGNAQGAGGGGSSWATSSATGVLNISNFNRGNGFVLIRY